MRVLHITTDAPGKISGGKIGVRQTLYSLSGCGYSIDYAGPKIDDNELKRLYTKCYELEPEKKLIVRGFDSIRGYTNQRYRSWKRLVRSSEFSMDSYDAVLLDFTKLDYAALDVPKEKLLVRVHNVEADYFTRNYEYDKSFVSFILMKTAKKREFTVAKRAAKLFVLTDHDRERLKELYGIEDDKFRMLPVCINGTFDIEKAALNWKRKESAGLGMIITGSLWFGPNYDGIKWFLENVYDHISSDKSLTIAGFKPNPDLHELVKKIDKANGRIRIIDSPEDMAPYFTEADISIAPIFDGAGMKVKTAEALSFGLPVIGTSHALTGYDIEHGVNSWRADTADEFIRFIDEYAAKSIKEKINARKAAYDLYLEKYSQKISTEIMRDEIEKCVRRKKNL